PSKGDTGHEKIEVVSSPLIKVETPDFLLSSSPGLDGFNLRNQFNQMYDGAYTTIDPIDQSVGKSFFNRELIKELGVIGDPIPDFSDGMDEALTVPRIFLVFSTFLNSPATTNLDYRFETSFPNHPFLSSSASGY
ncbi:hypothetical protein BB560_006319, partial [Smittium megazygosporum]